MPIEHAFRVFTSDFGRWWPKWHHLGSAPMAAAHIEPRAGGRWYELDEDGATCEWGIVLVWNPPRRIAVSLHIEGDSPSERVPHPGSRIEVRFKALSDRSTQVDLRHTGLDVHGEGWRRLRGRAPAASVTHAA